MEIVIQDSPGVFFIRLKSITGKYLETKVKTSMIEPLLKDQHPLFVLNHMIKFSQKVPFGGGTFIMSCEICDLPRDYFLTTMQYQPFLVFPEV